MPSYDKVLKELIQFKNDVMDGRYPQPTALGPGKLSKNTIKARTITGNMIDVSNLQAVNTNTGDLTVSGNLTIGTSGALRSGKTAYSDTINSGFWLGLDSGTPKFRMGSTAQNILWDGTTLTIVGTITATSGYIGGWLIGSTDLTSDTGATGIAASGSYRLWIGNSTPANAVFSVTSAGLLKTRSGDIGGWTIDNVGIRLGSGVTERGMDSGSTAFYAGGAPGSAAFRVTTAGAVSATNLTITGGSITLGTTFSVSAAGALTATSGTIGGVTIGASSLSTTNWSITNTGTMTSTAGTIGGLTINASDITVPSGKKIKFGASAADYLDNNILHFEMSGSETGKIEFKNGSNTYYNELRANASSTLARLNMQSTDSAVSNKFSAIYTDLSSGQAAFTLTASSQLTGGYGITLNGISTTSDSYLVLNIGGTEHFKVEKTNARALFRGYIYPGSGTGTQTSRYFSDNGTRTVLTGGDLDINNMTTSSPGNTAWASRGFAADAGGYIVLYVNGTGYKIPTYA